MPDLIRHPVYSWIPAFAGMTIGRYLIAGLIKGVKMDRFRQEFNFWTCCFYKKNRSNLFLSFEAISQNVDIGYLLLPDIVRKVGFGTAFKRLFPA